MPEQEATLRDVFISYSSADQDIVCRIVERLKEDGLSVFFAESDIHGGEQFIRKIEEGLRTHQVVVTLFSPSALDSFWVEAEWSARLIQMSRDRTRRLIPVLLHNVEDDQIPLLLQPLDRLDFRGEDLNDPVTLEEKVTELVQNIRGELPPPGVKALGVPFVVFAMIQREVNELISGNIFGDPAVAPLERKRFERLVEILAEHGFDDISDFYGRTREEWRPPIANLATIRDIVEEVVEQVNQHRQSTPGAPIICPQFFSTDFLSDNAAWRSQTWHQLDRLGCVLVIDAISMFHPLLRPILLRSEFGANERASIVVLSPVGPSVLPINQLLEQEIGCQMQRAFDRFAVHLDMLCEFGVGDMRALKRWLFSVLPETARTVQGLRATPFSREKMRERLGQPAGIDRAIFGQVRR
jgi:hypothetical protein